MAQQQTSSRFPADAKVLARELKPILNALEKGRLKSLRRTSNGWKKIGVGVLVSVILCMLILAVNGLRPATSPNVHPAYSAHDTGNDYAFLTVPVLIFGVIYGVVIYYKYINGHSAIYRSYYKSKVITGMTRLIQPDMVYSPNRGISEQTFRETGLYSNDIDRYSSEDLFAGKIGKTAIMFSEAHAEDKRRRTNSKGQSSTYWVTIFQGLLAIVDFNKDFRSWVVIKPDFAESSFGWLGRTIQNFSSDLVRLENPDFENAFVVHGGDQVEARYILTPDLQERLLELRRWFGDDIRIAFHSSRMHLTIPNTDDWFEPDIKISAHDTAQMHKFLHQMGAIFSIVQMLDLNTRIWTKH